MGVVVAVVIGLFIACVLVFKKMVRSHASVMNWAGVKIGVQIKVLVKIRFRIKLTLRPLQAEAKMDSSLCPSQSSCVRVCQRKKHDVRREDSDDLRTRKIVQQLKEHLDVELYDPAHAYMTSPSTQNK